MKRRIATGLLVALAGCGGGTSTSPSAMAPQPPPPPAGRFEITTLITVYPSAEDSALFSRGKTKDERIGRILLGVDDLATAVGATNLNNEAGRVRLEQTVERIRREFSDADYLSAFDETRVNLDRYMNDADGDGWAIDGRHGLGRDWPFDQDGNDPDGWTAQIVVIVEPVGS